jgi:transcription initiation factor IIE alpha subunit
MLSDRANPIDAPAQPSAFCSDCGYECDFKTADELEGICPECSNLLESNDDD